MQESFPRPRAQAGRKNVQQQIEVRMYCFLKPFRCSSRAHRSLPSFRPQLEQLDERLVLSTLSSAISIQHQGWTERDWYAVDQASTGVLAFKDASPNYIPLGPSGV